VDANHTVRVGVGVVVARGEEVLMLKRHNAHGAGSWAPPGGHLDYLESPAVCACREVREEAGVEIESPRLIDVTIDTFDDIGRHYVTLWLHARYSSGTAHVASPREVAAFGWFRWDALPQPFFLSFAHLVGGAGLLGWRDHGPAASLEP
jgi:8-oxo-dGTP diphosphatase